MGGDGKARRVREMRRHFVPEKGGEHDHQAGARIDPREMLPEPHERSVEARIVQDENALFGAPVIRHRRGRINERAAFERRRLHVIDRRDMGDMVVRRHVMARGRDIREHLHGERIPPGKAAGAGIVRKALAKHRRKVVEGGRLAGKVHEVEAV